MRIHGRALFAVLEKLRATFLVGLVEGTALKNKLLTLGLGGTLFAILCCFTPLLPIVLTALGLTGLLGVLYNDAVLLPMLAGFLILTGYATWREKKQK
jgi:mercuric ion transport protein